MDYATELTLEECFQEFKVKHTTAQSTVLSSECPGWACYAEKALDEVIIPYMSNVKSPQQLMGTLVKQNLAKELGLVRLKSHLAYQFIIYLIVGS